MAILDIAGLRFARLSVLGVAAKNDWRTNQAHWLCRCDCGNQKIVRGVDLRSGHTQSCGCLLRGPKPERRGLNNPNFKHGARCQDNNGRNQTRTYNSFYAMHARCERPANDNYYRYGAIGVRVCKRWSGEHGFETFLADMGERPIGKTLDRKFKGKVYCKRECCWATHSEQTRNRCSWRKASHRRSRGAAYAKAA